MHEVSAQQDESSVGLFRGAGCVSSPSPLLLSLSPSFLPPPFIPSARVSPLLPSFSAPLASWWPRPISFIPVHLSFNNGRSNANIFVVMIRDTVPDGRHQHHKRSSNSADTCHACSWCSVKVRTKDNISTQTAQNYQAPFGYKKQNKKQLCDITNSSFWYHKSYFMTSTNNLWFCDIAKLILWYQKLIFSIKKIKFVTITYLILWYHTTEFMISQNYCDFFISQNRICDIKKLILFYQKLILWYQKSLRFCDINKSIVWYHESFLPFRSLE